LKGIVADLAKSSGFFQIQILKWIRIFITDERGKLALRYCNTYSDSDLAKSAGFFQIRIRIPIRNTDERGMLALHYEVVLMRSLRSTFEPLPFLLFHSNIGGFPRGALILL
jgi:hypothetical protein